MKQKTKSGIQNIKDLSKDVVQILYGYYKISGLKQPCVSIFGGSRLEQDSFYAQQARKSAGLLVENNISVLTGGGPGIMEAANCGATAANKGDKSRTIGIAIGGLNHKETTNTCASEVVVLNNFFARKWLLINYSIGFVAFPGGLGTLDEIADLLNSMQTGKIPITPVILIGSDFWKPLSEWFTRARTDGYLYVTEPPVVITDDINEAVALLVQHVKK